MPRLRQAIVVLSALSVVGILVSGSANASAYYGYDPLNRVTTALYDNGVCVVYAYDANGNRTSQTNTASGPSESPTWGSGVWGCFSWTSQ